MDLGKPTAAMRLTSLTAGAVRASVVAVVVAGGLSACDGVVPIVTETPTPTALPSRTPAPSVSASPSQSPSASGAPAPLSDEELLELLPPGAQFPDVEGAANTAPYFLEQYAPMFHTGNTQIWESLSKPECKYCASALESAQQVRDRGYKALGGEMVTRMNSIRADLADDGSVYMSLTADVAESRLISPEGEETVTDEAGPAKFSFKMDLVGDVWRVSGVNVDSPE